MAVVEYPLGPPSLLLAYILSFPLSSLSLFLPFSNSHQFPPPPLLIPSLPPSPLPSLLFSSLPSPPYLIPPSLPPSLPPPSLSPSSIIANRQGNVVLFHQEGGVDVGDVDSKATKVLVDIESSLTEEQAKQLVSSAPLETQSVLVRFLQVLYEAYSDLYFTLLEINPLGNGTILL